MSDDISIEETNEFLRSRGLSEAQLLKIELEKIGPDVILHMTDSQLQEFIPKLGDRVAVRQFINLKTKCDEPCSTRKNQLLSRLRLKLQNKNTLSQDGEECSSIKKKKIAGHYLEEKQITLGWLCRMNGEYRYKQVREKGGGGTRKIKVPKTANKEFIKKKAVDLFFPDGKSPKGMLTGFDTDLLDFKNNKIDEYRTVKDFLESTGFSVLRFYLATSQKSDTEERRCSEMLEDGGLPLNEDLPLNQNMAWTNNLEVHGGNTSDGELFAQFEELNSPTSMEYNTACDSDNNFPASQLDPNKTTQENLNELINNILDENENTFQKALVSFDTKQYISQDNDFVQEEATDKDRHIPLQEFQSVRELLSKLQQNINPEKLNKFNIFRQEIFSCCVRAMRRKTFDPFNKISVKFSDMDGNAEGAVDEGGPTREMFRLVLDYLRNSELFVGQRKRHITLNNKCLRENLYFEAGRIIALSLVHGGPGPCFFSPTLFSLIADGNACITPEIGDVEDDIRAKIAKLEELVEISDIQNFITSENVFSIAGVHYIKTLEEKHTVVADTLIFFAIKRIETALQQFIEGLKTCSIYHHIRQYPHLFRNLFCEEKSSLTADDLENMFAIQYSAMGSNKRSLENRTISYFRDYLVDCEEIAEHPCDFPQDSGADTQSLITLVDILVFSTGADAIPPLGFPQNPKITFLHNNDKYPMANTCAVELKLPTCHITYEHFKEHMSFGIGNSKCFGFA